MPWDIAGLRHTNQQQGMEKYCLCSECNNNTGAWYGNDYSLISHVIHCTLENPLPENIHGIGIKEVYPLHFIKQVLSVFCSINNFDDPRIEVLGNFVLNKTEMGLDKTKHKICMYFTKSHFMKYAPLSVILKMNDLTWESIAISEITAYVYRCFQAIIEDREKPRFEKMVDGI